MRIKKFSKTLLEQYRVLRILFHRNRLYQELVSETDLNEKKAIRALGKLISAGYVRKQKIFIETPKELDLTDVGIAKSLLGVTEKRKKFTHEYSLTKSGEKKLAYYEYTLQLYQRWRPPWQKDNEYYKDVTKIIINQRYFGRPPLEV